MTLNETHIFSQALVNEARVGFNRININFNPTDRRQPGGSRHQQRHRLADRAAADHDHQPRAELRRAGGLPAGAHGDDVRRVATPRPTCAATTSSSSAASSGASRSRPSPTIPGTFTLSERRGVSGRARQRVQRSRSATGRRNCYITAVGGFVQDSISLGSSVKLDLGLRYDYIGVADRAGQQARRLRRRHRRRSSRSARGIDQVHEERQRLPAAPRRHLESDR